MQTVKAVVVHILRRRHIGIIRNNLTPSRVFIVHSTFTPPDYNRHFKGREFMINLPAVVRYVAGIDETVNIQIVYTPSLIENYSA
jgi:hypothetical protein